jgi:putative flippase GtrA
MRDLRSLADPRFIRFLLVGGLNTAFGYGVFALLYLVGLHYAVAGFFSTVLGVLFNFFSTGRLVFGNREVALLPRYVLVYATTYVLGTLLLRVAELLKIPILAASAVLLLPMSVVAFLLQRRLVFGGKKRSG